MMNAQVIWKQTIAAQDLDDRGCIQIALPADARVLHVAEQHDLLTFWYTHPQPTGPTSYRQFKVVMTGEMADLGGFVYRGTALLDTGRTVVHLWERENG